MTFHLFEPEEKILISEIRADNFKSLSKFELLNLQQFNCLIGLNGVGKSTLLQFFDFLSQQVKGNMKGWLKDRSWQQRDIKSSWNRKSSLVTFEVAFVDPDRKKSIGRWTCTYNLSEARCTKEELETEDATLQVEDGRYMVSSFTQRTLIPLEAEMESIRFDYEGSILSQLKEKEVPYSIRLIKNFIGQIKSLHLLSPESLRRQSHGKAQNLGIGGERLSSFIHSLGKTGQERLTRMMKEVYPRLKAIDTKALNTGRKSLEIQEEITDSIVVTEARHINDGMLRLMAILAELETEDQFLLFDEIENGINPELVEFVVDHLVKAKQQVMVTTHSPMILNYLEDEVAKKGVIYLYKNSKGETRSIPFFEIPSLAKKLEVMGPGEAFVDTDLTRLKEEIDQMKENG